MGSHSLGSLVSVVMPVFNGMPFIEEAVASVLAQGYSNFELAILDNASLDGTRDFLRQISDPRVRVALRTETQSVGSNWTEATRFAQGDFVKLVCADDVLAPHALTSQVTALVENPNAVMVASQRNVVNAHGKLLKRNHGLGGLRGEVSREKAIKACMRAGTNLFGEPVCTLFRTDALLQALPWQDEAGYLTDLATYTRALRSGSVICLPDTAGSFRLSRDSWTTQIVHEQQQDFRRWRTSMVESGEIPWSPVDELVGNLKLHARTRVRRWYINRS